MITIVVVCSFVFSTSSYLLSGVSYGASVGRRSQYPVPSLWVLSAAEQLVLPVCISIQRFQLPPVVVRCVAAAVTSVHRLGY